MPLTDGSTAATNLSDSKRRRGVGQQERSGTSGREDATVATCLASQQAVRQQAADCTIAAANVGR